MTDEERKQFINEYCRNVGNIKIKCDDCKFVEDCVDYGWEGCKKFTPAPSKPLTNEEWFASLSTKEKAKWMFELTYKCYWCGREYAKTKKFNEKECPFHKCLDDSKGFEKWLKKPHGGES